jgi:hypothetical protein
MRINTEFDVQVAAYHHIRKEFEKNSGDIWIIRSQPVMQCGKSKVKPDIVFFKGTVPYDVIEIKCFFDRFDRTKLSDDLDKLRRLKDECNIRHAYMLFLYDEEKNITLKPHQKEEWMKSYLSYAPGNLRKKLSGRARAGYSSAKKRWEQYYR